VDEKILTKEEKKILKRNIEISQDEEVSKFYPGAVCAGHLGEIDKRLYRFWIWMDKKGHKIITLDEGNCCCRVVQVFKPEAKDGDE